MEAGEEDSLEGVCVKTMSQARRREASGLTESLQEL